MPNVAGGAWTHCAETRTSRVRSPLVPPPPTLTRRWEDWTATIHTAAILYSRATQFETALEHRQEVLIKDGEYSTVTLADGTAVAVVAVRVQCSGIFDARAAKVVHGGVLARRA